MIDIDESELLTYLDRTLPLVPTDIKTKEIWVKCHCCGNKSFIRYPIIARRDDIERFKKLLARISEYADKEFHVSSNMLREMLEHIYSALLEEKQKEDTIEYQKMECQRILEAMEQKGGLK